MWIFFSLFPLPIPFSLIIAARKCAFKWFSYNISGVWIHIFRQLKTTFRFVYLLYFYKYHFILNFKFI